MTELNQRRFLVFVLVLTFAIYARSIQNGFVNFDDPAILIDNGPVLDFDFVKLFQKPLAHDYVPLTLLSFAVENRLFGLTPSIYHFDNLALHLINCLLVFWLLIVLTQNNFNVSALTALLFAIHPLHVESVAWVTERKDVLSCLFYLLTCINYLRYLDTSNRKNYYSALGFAILAILSKSMAMTIPFVLLLFDYLRGRKLNEIKLIEKVPFFALSIVFITIGWPLQHVMAEADPTLSLINGLYFFEALCFYLSRSILPIGLSVLYENSATRLGFLGYLLGVLVLMWIFRAINKPHPERKHLVFGILFFLIGGAPVWQIIRFKTLYSYADRYFYIPSIGLLLCYALLVTHFKPIPKKIIIISIAVLFSFLSFDRVGVWQNTGTLWADVISKYPESQGAHRDLGIFLLRHGENQGAKIHLEKAIKINPKLYDAHNALGNVYLNLGQLEKALEEFHLASENNDFAEPVGSEAYIYTKAGEFSKAIELFKKAISINPKLAYLHLHLCVALYLSKDPHGALPECEEAVRLEPDMVKGHQTLGSIYHEFGREDESKRELLMVDRITARVMSTSGPGLLY